MFTDRLRGPNMELFPALGTSSEYTLTTLLNSFDQDGVSIGSDSYNNINVNGVTYINYFFRRTPGVFDEVAYTGDGTNGRSIAHSLSTTPELVIYKSRSGSSGDPGWAVVGSPLSNYTKYAYLNTTAAAAALAGTWTYGASNFSISSNADASVNASSVNYVAYLFATYPNVSKVGSYTGNGSTQTINAGFSGNAQGARFILVKRTDSTGDWYVWDSTR